jgi:aspartyl-tRNA(Asn)/glutamyl-tRNA(Gln) amidotransferase subunit A
MTSRGGAATVGKLDGGMRGMKIGVAKEFFERLAPDVSRVMDETLKTLERIGARLVPVDFPLLRHSLPAYYILACAEASSNLGRYDGLRYGYAAEKRGDMDEFVRRTRSEGFGAEVRRRILLGTCVLSTGYYDAYYNKAMLLKNAVSNEYSRILKECDCLATPTAPTTAMKRGVGQGMETYQSDICTVTVNIAGLPALNVPCGFGDGALPVGLQLIGAKHREDVVFSVSRAFETETDGEYIRIAGTEVAL